MIPKRIHYCWFGGNPLTESAKKCIESWKKFCPDYEIIEWNESNFDVNCCDYVCEAYKAEKWAFVSDVARLAALVTHGGIYMDTDVEVIRSLDDLLDQDAFVCFESKNKIATSLMACQMHHSLFKELLEIYDMLHFVKPNGLNDQTTNVKRITDYCVKYGLKLDGSLQKIKGMTIYPAEYFSPLDFDTGKLRIAFSTYSIHWFDASWMEPNMQYQLRLNWKLNKFLPAAIAYNISRFVSISKFCGIGEAFKKTAERLLKTHNMSND